MKKAIKLIITIIALIALGGCSEHQTHRKPILLPIMHVDALESPSEPLCEDWVCIGDDTIIIDTDGTQFTINKLLKAIYLAEGGSDAKRLYGILSVTCSGNTCRRIARRTVRRNLARYNQQQQQGNDSTYLAFLANRYCPIGSGNDPQNLNQYWLNNVKSLL